MCNPTLVTVFQVQPHYSQSSCASRGTSPLASYKELPPPPSPNSKNKLLSNVYPCSFFLIGIISTLKKRISYWSSFMNTVYCLSIVNVPTEGIVAGTKSGFLVNSFIGLHNANCSFFFILLSYHSTWFFHFVFFPLFSFKRAKVSDEIPEATEDYSKEFSKLSSKTEMDKVPILIIILKQCTVLNATLSQ